MVFPERLKQLRKEKGLSQTMLAQNRNKERSTIA